MQFELSEKELRIKQLRLVAFIMIVLFLFILSYTIIWTTDYNKMFKGYTYTEATIVDIKNVDTKTCDVIKYVIGGNEYIMETEYCTNNKIGKKVGVYYESENPVNIIYPIDSRRFVLPIISLVFGCASVGLLITYILIYRSNKIQNTRKNKKKASD